MNKIVLIFIFALVISACGPMLWHKPGASQDDFARDKYKCMQESQQRVSNAQISIYGGASESKIITNDNLYNSCMNSKGWVLRSNEDIQRISQQQNYQKNTTKEQQSKKLQNMTDIIKIIQDQLMESCSKQEYEKIFKKSACKVDDFTLDQLSDSSKIKSEEKFLFEQLNSEHKSIIKRTISAFRSAEDKLGLSLASFVEKLEETAEENTLALYQEKISWGEYNKARKSISASYKNIFNEVTAKEALVNEVSGAPKPSAEATGIGLSLPPGWEKNALTQDMVSNGGSVYALNKSIDAGVLVSVANRDGVGDLIDYATSRRANLESRLLNPQSTEIVRSEINGNMALSFEVSGFVKGGLKITYLYTIIVGSKQLVVVNSWAKSIDFVQHKSKLEALSSNITGLF